MGVLVASACKATQTVGTRPRFGGEFVCTLQQQCELRPRAFGGSSPVSASVATCVSNDVEPFAVWTVVLVDHEVRIGSGSAATA